MPVAPGALGVLVDRHVRILIRVDAALRHVLDVDGVEQGQGVTWEQEQVEQLRAWIDAGMLP